jgi:N-methylhydantoinase A
MTPPIPLVPRRLRVPVTERMRADGSVEIPLDAAALTDAIDYLREVDVQAVAVCFLHAWRNPAHEQQAAAAVHAQLPQTYVTTSFEVLPQIKEFERFSTTVANAAVGPVIESYLERLQSRLRSTGYEGELLVILSHGGVASAAEATRLAAGTALSGPAGGVAAAVALARDGLASDIISFDMGGTSTDIAVLRGGQPLLSGDKSVAGVKIALPSLDIVTLGAGGGSIAKLDRSGLLTVGPDSAGAAPGPACYGQGGTRATATDAHVVLGHLDPENFLGGRRRLDLEAARRVVATLAAELGVGIVETAAGILRVINNRMADGVRVATVRRGIDPRRFTLLAFGGAAGLHIAEVAAELGISRVAIPLAASVLSAWGMLNTDLRVELSRSQAQTAGLDTAALQSAFSAMEAEGRARLAWFDGELTLHRSADMRYGEQVFEIPVGLDEVDWTLPTLAAHLTDRFHAAHERLYTYALRDQEVFLVNARLSVIGRLPQMEHLIPSASRIEVSPKLQRQIYLGGRWTEVPVLDFSALGVGQCVRGPAVVESDTTTVLLRSGDVGHFDERGWLELTIDGSKTSA